MNYNVNEEFISPNPSDMGITPVLVELGGGRQLKITVPMEKAHRLLSPRMAYLITTVSAKGSPNVAAMSYVIPISEDPESILLSITSDTRTYANLRATRQFVVNVAEVDLLDSIWICGGHYEERNMASRPDKFALACLTAIPSDMVKPPRIEECYGHVECKVSKFLKYGDHCLVMGHVVAVSHSPGAFDSTLLLSPDIKPAMQLTGSHFVSLGTRHHPTSETGTEGSQQDSPARNHSASSVDIVRE